MEILEGGAICRKDLQISYYDCDVNNRIRLSSVLRQAQQISMEHCDLLGFDEKFMDNLGMVFLLGKISIRIQRLPSATERIVITTIPDTQPTRAQYKRAITFDTTMGERLLEIDSRWILVDKSNNKIVRHKPETLDFPSHSYKVFDHNMKIEKDCIEIGKYETSVVYSTLDVNKHMNNTVYADIVCDSISQVCENSPLFDKKVKEIKINYKNEALFGETITSHVNKCVCDEDTFVVNGKTGEKDCFDGQITFCE